MRWKNSLSIILILFFILIAVFKPVQIGSAEGDSMIPNIEDGDIFICSKYFSLEEKNLYVYNSSKIDYNVLHRLKEIQDNDLVFKGDNNNFRDKYDVEKSEIICEVKYIL